MKLAYFTNLYLYNSNVVIFSFIAFALVALLVLILFVDFNR